MPLQHQPGSDDHEVFHPAEAARTMRPIGSHQTEVERQRIDPVAGDRKVIAAQKKLDRLLAADAAGPVITRARAAVENAKTDFLERVAEARHVERTKVLAQQRETKRLRHEREVLYRLDQSLTPSIVLNFGPLQITVTPERSPDATMRAFAYKDLHAALQIISTSTNHAAALAQNAEQKIEVIPTDVPRLRRVLEDVMRRSIRAGLTTIEEIA